MRTMITAVSGFGFRDKTRNSERTEALTELLMVCRKMRVDLLVLPGGYWTVAPRTGLDDLMEVVREEVAGKGVAVVGGIDLPEMAELKYYPVTMLTTRTVPAFAFGVDTKGRLRGPWRQLSSLGSGEHSCYVRSLDPLSRMIQVGRQEALVLICGEMLNDGVRDSLQGLQPDLVADLAHWDMDGHLVTEPFRAVNRVVGCPVVQSQHLSDTGHCLYGWGKDDYMRVEHGDRTPLDTGAGQFWLEWAVLDFPSR